MSFRKHASFLVLLIGASIAAPVGYAEIPIALVSALEQRANSTKTVFVAWRQTTTSRDRSNPKDVIVQESNWELRILDDLVDLRQAMGLPMSRLPTRRSVWDGRSSRQFTSGSGTSKGSLLVESQPYRYVSDYLHIRPVFINYRGFHEYLGKLAKSQYQPLDGQFHIEGRECIVIEEVGAKPIRKQYWFDKSRDYLVVRYVSTINGAESIRQDITYRNDPALGWMPSSWRSVFVDDDGQLNQSDECVIEKYEVNGHIDRSEFELEESGLNRDKTVVVKVDHGNVIPAKEPARVPWLFVAGVVLLFIGAAGGFARWIVRK